MSINTPSRGAMAGAIALAPTPDGNNLSSSFNSFKDKGAALYSNKRPSCNLNKNNKFKKFDKQLVYNLNNGDNENNYAHYFANIMVIKVSINSIKYYIK